MGLLGAVMNTAVEVKIVVYAGGVISHIIDSSGLSNIERKTLVQPGHGQSIASKGRHSSLINMLLSVLKTPEILNPE